MREAHDDQGVEIEHVELDAHEQDRVILNEALYCRGLRVSHRDSRMVAVTIANRQSVGPTFDAGDFEGMYQALLTGEIDGRPA